MKNKIIVRIIKINFGKHKRRDLNHHLLLHAPYVFNIKYFLTNYLIML